MPSAPVSSLGAARPEARPLDRKGLHVVQRRLQCVFERGDLLSDLGEDHPALEGGQEQVRKLPGIGLGAQSAATLQIRQRILEDLPPLAERARELVMDVEVGLDDLAGERAEGASFVERAFVSNIEGGPLPESLEVFAPLANRLGLGKLKMELEDLSFRYTDPDAYRHITESVNARLEEP